MTVRRLNVHLLGIILIAASRIHQAQQQELEQVSSSNISKQQQEAAAATSGSLCRRDADEQSGIGAGGIAGYLLAQPTDSQLNRSDSLDSTLASILDRIGPDMRPLRDFRDFGDISVDVAKRAWKLMHDHALAAAIGRLRLVGPIVERALVSANVSRACISAATKTMDAAQRLDSWAIQLLTAWGNFPPTGIFEGTFGDIGSFHGCVGVPQNPVIGHAHYCTIAYRPVLPVRDPYELIVRGEPDELLRLFERKQTTTQDAGSGSSSNPKVPLALNEDAFSELLRHAQYNHYVYYKLGTCFPIQCSPRDVQKVARHLGKQSILMSGPVKCHSKFEDDYGPESISDGERSSSSNQTGSFASNGPTQKALQISTRDLNDGVYIWKPHTTRAQRISLIIISAVCLFIVFMTLVDLAINRLPTLYATIAGRHRIVALLGGVNGSVCLLNGASKAATSGPETAPSEATGARPKLDYDANNNMNPIDGMFNGCQRSSILQTFKISSLNDTKCESPPPEARPRVVASNDESEDDDVDGETEGQETIVINGLGGRRQKQKRPEQGMWPSEKPTKENGNNKKEEQKLKRSLFMEMVDDCSIVTNLRQFFHISQGQLNNDILCINGIRCITMSWIIITHTMQYNDWSAFARTREIETHLKSLINQPLFNGSYLVDTFFLVSGLLTSLSSFRNSTNHSHKSRSNGASYAAAAATDIDADEVGRQRNRPASLLEQFSPRSYLIGRYLRLTPQIMLVSILFILLPLLSRSGGPHWYTITGEYSENCSQNWWLNLFYIQAFYRSNEMCNFVCWWISVDMFYHLFALAVIMLILYYGHKAAPISCIIIVAGHWTIQVTRHYQLNLPPNLLSTIPQTGAMWSQMTLESFWTPYAHSFPFFLGLYVGNLMAQRKSKLEAWFNLKRALIGWTLAISLLLLQSYSTYYWVTGEWRYSRLVATLFYLVGPIVWATCLSWIIVACQYGYGSWINSMLSCKLFIILGKASYIVYLSHFLVIQTFFGSQNLLLEPTQLVMLYVVIGNICLSMFFGSCLCVFFEMPWLKTQKRIMKFV